MPIEYCRNCRAEVGVMLTPNGPFPRVCQVCGSPYVSKKITPRDAN